MENDLINRQAAINEIMDDLKDTSLHDDPATPEDYAEGYDEGNRNAAAIVLQMPSAQPEQPEIIRCKDCKHKPYPSDNYDYDNGDCGFEIIFPDYRCPCRCEDEYYNRIPDDDWFCGNAERKTDE